MTSKSRGFLDQFHEWNSVTGALEPGTGWFYECVSIFEDADKEVARLTQERDETQTRFEELRDLVYDTANVERDKLAAELDRYKHALWTANGFLMGLDREPVKLEYPAETPLKHPCNPADLPPGEHDFFKNGHCARCGAKQTGLKP